MLAEYSRARVRPRRHPPPNYVCFHSRVSVHSSHGFALSKVRCAYHHRAKPLWIGPSFHVVAAHFGTLGFPGEGPGVKKRQRNPGGGNQSIPNAPSPAPTTPIHEPTPAKTAGTSSASANKGGRPSFIYSVEWVQEQLAKDDGLELIAERLNNSSRRAREWQRKALGIEAEVKGGDIRLPRQEPSMAHVPQ